MRFPPVGRWTNVRTRIVLDRSELATYVDIDHLTFSKYELREYNLSSVIRDRLDIPANALVASLPLSILLDRLTVVVLKMIAQLHGITALPSRVKRGHLIEALTAHECTTCESCAWLLTPYALPLTTAQDIDWTVVVEGFKTFASHDIDEMRSPERDFSAFGRGAKVVAIRLAHGGEPVPPVQPHVPVVEVDVPVLTTAIKLGKKSLMLFGRAHGIIFPTKWRVDEMQEQFRLHKCNDTCPSHSLLLTPVTCSAFVEDYEDDGLPAHWPEYDPCDDKFMFPPRVPSLKDKARIIRDFLEGCTVEKLEQFHCAVCAQLKDRDMLRKLEPQKLSLLPLINEHCAFKPRQTAEEPVEYIKEPILAPESEMICNDCFRSLENGVRPKLALANNLWLGEVPECLKILTYAEQLLVARIRHNRSVVRVSTGHTKMVANVVSYANPTPLIYAKLPPHRRELQDVLVFIFVGVQPPSDDDFKRTPIVVRRRVVLEALEWLCLNHCDYGDVVIDKEALESYPEGGPAVQVLYHPIVDGEGNVIPSAVSVHETDLEQGTEDGPCPYRVHGLTEDRHQAMTVDERKLAALMSLNQGGAVVAVGHEEEPESIYRNPGLYPQMFPWLFPTGFGTIGDPEMKGLISDTTHKRWLLNYYDKRFQNDGTFVIVAFNHDQVKTCSTRSFIMAKRKDFDMIARKVRDIHPMALHDISVRMKEGSKVTPQTDEERKCFALLDLIKNVTTGVSGSLADKRNYRSELWSLTYFEGPPSWFITLAPTDHKNPLCVYLCNSEFKLNGHLLPSGVRQKLTSMNPVACAKFFHHVVQMFITHILGWKHPKGGRYGDVKGYYGMVEQQGRMTLHLHAVVWIRGALSPTEIRRRLLDENSEFRKSLIAYLEDCQVGNFMTGSMEDVLDQLDHEQENNASYVDPTVCVPPMPPVVNCSEDDDCHCEDCTKLESWFEEFKLRVDDILMRCNRHTTCEPRKDTTGNEVRADPRSPKGKGCVNKDGVCTARFPRPTFKETEIDPKDGHINLKKLESMMNSVTPELSYVLGCNTDVSSLLSGNAMKAVIGYVTDYITKGSLRTYQIFSTSYDVFVRNQELQDEDQSAEREREAARKLIMKVSNSLTAKTEIGAPMAALYLLGNPDRYTSHTFVPFYWKSYFNYVQTFFLAFEGSQDQGDEADDEERDSGNIRVEESVDATDLEDESDSDEEDDEPDTVVPVRKMGGAYVGKSNVDDYRYRPRKFSGLSVYEWIQCAVRAKDGQPGDSGQSSRAGLTFYRYMEGHPLRDSHWVTADPSRRSDVVPNFLGHMIPRADEGDIEVYCCAMLTIFKPWRTPFDLKNAGQSWENAFDDHPFTARDRRLMANLNLRYECYDARDDYAAQLAKTAMPNMNDDDIEHLNNDEHEDMYGVDEISAAFFMEDSGRTKDNDAAMASAQYTLLQAGWNVPERQENLDGVGDATGSDVDIVIGRKLTTEGWKRLVTKERKKAQLKMFGLPLVSADNDQVMEDEEGAWYNTNSSLRVFVVPGCYLTQDFKMPIGISSGLGADLQTIIRGKYSLNYEQEKAFNIITNHALSPGAQQLKMYIGGMGGTGKSQVLKAVIEFFRDRVEDYRIVVLAPTGNAASLIDGSTYHSYLKIYPGERAHDKANKIDELKTQLRLVDYIFIDEISMMSCFDMFKVSERLMDATGVKDKPFGGLNMIFAGDFAQLPPTTGYSLYSSRIAEYQSPRQTLTEQNNTIGKRAWLQVTTVVILKQNMRQSHQSPEDAKLRRALQNLRYYDCDDADIEFLRSRIPKNNPSIDMNSDEFRYAAVITALNVHKDGLNDVYSDRFSQEHGKRLYSFYSIDKPVSENPRNGRRNFSGKKARMTVITRKLQKLLWAQPGNTSKNIPGRLKICMDMPVCIRYNIATELCITKGQEGTVVGWTSKKHPNYPDVECLEVLFVKLKDPPKQIKLPHLPQNVVPITKTSTPVRARWRNDFSTMINRTQMPVLPNFSMTDYASQGKTRDANVVDLVNCRNFQAVYTCLSRGKTAAGTVIIQDFNQSKLRGKLDKDLRIEYRDLARLDEVTDLVYRGSIADGILYNTRRGTLESYDEWKSTNSSEEECASPRAGMKRAMTASAIDDNSSSAKKAKRANNQAGGDGHGPIGLAWDSKDYSCAYDSVVSLLYNIWRHAAEDWSTRFSETSSYLRCLADEFKLVGQGSQDLNNARNVLRNEMWRDHPEEFPMGHQMCDMGDLLRRLLNQGEVRRGLAWCKDCSRVYDSPRPFMSIGTYMRMAPTSSIAEYIRDLQSGIRCCPYGHVSGWLQHEFGPWIWIQTEGSDDFTVSTSFQNAVGSCTYRLAGILYLGSNHFVTRFVNPDGGIFFHDSMAASPLARYEGDAKVGDWGKRLLKTGDGKTGVVFLYVRIAHAGWES